MPSPEMLGPATLGVGQTIGAFQFFLPKLSDVRKATMDDVDMVGDVRMGEVAALTVCLGVGAIVSSMTGSVVPIAASAVMAMVLICIYETTLKADRPWEPKKGALSDAA